MTDEPLYVDGVIHRRMMGAWVTGVCLVTTTTPDGRPAGCTLNALTSLSLEPPSLIVALGTESRTLVALQAAGVFGVNVLATDQEDVARRFAHGGLSAEERFESTAHEVRHGVPLITGSVVSLVCELTDAIPLHDHVIVAGKVVLGWHDDERTPLVFFGGAYEAPRVAVSP